MNVEEKLRREIGLPGAIMLGLGSIVGTGVFVSIGLAADIAGSHVVLAILIAACVAICNGLSSAQLAAVHPVSGGTYEYGHRWLSPGLGFSAGWLFLCAKSASAATAALGLAGYLNSCFEIPGSESKLTYIGIALAMLVLMTVVVLIGIKRTTTVNTVIVSVTLVGLAAFVLVGLPTAILNAGSNFDFSLGLSRQDSDGSQSWYALFNASALMFVAYTGYGRIATMGEEVANPRKAIPRAMIVTLAVTLVLYLSVGFVAVGTVGAESLSAASGRWAAPLMLVTEALQAPWLTRLLAVAAITAMLGVMLNLLLGLSRVALAMSRRNDLPHSVSRINQSGVPVPATILVAAVISVLICLGDIKLSWSFSALTVLVYYAFTNICALRVDPSERVFSIWTAWFGLLGCLSLALFVPWQMWIAGGVVLLIGFAVRFLVGQTAGRVQT